MYYYNIPMPADRPLPLEDCRRYPWPFQIPQIPPPPPPPPAQSSDVPPPPPEAKLKWHPYPDNHTNITVEGMLHDMSLAEEVQWWQYPNLNATPDSTYRNLSHVKTAFVGYDTFWFLPCQFVMFHTLHQHIGLALLLAPFA